MVELKDFCLESSKTILSALNRLDVNGHGILFVVEDGILYGSLTDGDVRRALIGGATKEDCVKDFCNQYVTYRHVSTSEEEVRALFNNDIRVIPLLDDNNRIVDIRVILDLGCG